MTKLIGQDEAIAIPASLRDQIEQYQGLPDDLRQGWKPVHVPGAEQLADALQAELAAQTPEDVIAGWLLDLETAVATNLSPKQIAGRISTVLNVLGNLPPCCWTRETFLVAAKTFRFFPTVAELHDLLDPIRARQVEAIRLIREAAKATVPDGFKRGQPHVVTSTPDWVGKQGRNFDPRPERGEIKFREPIRTVEEQLRSLNFPEPADVIKNALADTPDTSDKHSVPMADAVAMALRKLDSPP